MDDVGLHHQVLIDEIGAVGVIGVDAADLGGRQKNIFRSFVFKKLVNCPLVEQIEVGMGTRRIDVGIPTACSRRMIAEPTSPR